MRGTDGALAPLVPCNEAPAPGSSGREGGVTEVWYRQRRGEEGGEHWWDRPLALQGECGG